MKDTGEKKNADVDISGEKLVNLHRQNSCQIQRNKKQLVDLLRNYLNQRGIKTTTAEEVADLLIMQTTIDLKQYGNGSVTVAVNDVDLLIY